MSRVSLPCEEVLRRARTARAVMLFMPDKVDSSFLDQCPDLRIIAGAFKGYNNVDIKACTDHGVWFTVARGLLTVPTAELAISLLHALAGNVVAGDLLVWNGDFTPHLGSAIDDVRRPVALEAAANIYEDLTGTRPGGVVNALRFPGGTVGKEPRRKAPSAPNICCPLLTELTEPSSAFYEK